MATFHYPHTRLSSPRHSATHRQPAAAANAALAPATAQPLAGPSATVSAGAPGLQSCPCGGGCPRCGAGTGASQALDALARVALEARYGPRLANVRVHADSEAAASAARLHARAYTVGHDIVFAAGQYRPHTLAGRRLLAHELAHVVQRPLGTTAAAGATAAATATAWERDADRMAAATTSAGAGLVVPNAPAANMPALLREPDPVPAPPADAPFRIPGTPITVTPLEPARGNESITLLGIRLPYRSVRLSDELDVAPMPALPVDLNGARSRLTPSLSPSATLPGNWRDLGGMLHLQPDALTPPGQPARSVPRFSLTVSTDGSALDVTDRIPLELRPGVIPGTPLNEAPDPANIRQHVLSNASLHVGKRVFAAGRLSLRDEYSLHGTDPTDVDISARSVPLASINARRRGDTLDFGQIGSVRAGALGVGAVKGEVSAFLDLGRIEAALAPIGLDATQQRKLLDVVVQAIEAKVDELKRVDTLGSALDALSSLSQGGGSLSAPIEQIVLQRLPAGTSPQLVHRVVENVVAEALGPGFEIHGPVFFGAPIGYFKFRADTTRYLRPPFEGSGIGTPFPASLATIGPTLIPAGVISEIKSPAGGVSLARDWEHLALSATIAGRPELATGSIGAGGVATARMGFRLHGFDVILEGGWRGHTALGKTAAGGDPQAQAFDAIAQARQEAQARYTEGSEGNEAGVFAPDLLPAEVLSGGRPNAEFYGNFRIVRHWK